MSTKSSAKAQAQSLAEYAVAQLVARGCSFADVRTFEDRDGYRYEDVANVGAYDRHPDIVRVSGVGATGIDIAIRYGDWPSDEERAPILTYATAVGIALMVTEGTLSISTEPHLAVALDAYKAIDLAKQRPTEVDARLEAIAGDLIANGVATLGTWVWIDPKPGEWPSGPQEPEPEDTLSDDLLAFVDDASFDELVLGAEGPVLVDFWAPWCGPCRRMAPLLKRLVSEHPGRIAVAKLNVDENAVSKARYDVKGIPRLILFENGRQVAEHVGALPYPQLVVKFVERGAP